MKQRVVFFSTKSLYKALELGSSVLFPMKNIWKSCVQPKVSFFTWEASWGKVLTLDQVKKRGQALANRCYFCQAEEESIDHHLLLHCEKTRVLWEMPFTLFGVSWVFPSSVRETLLGWNGFLMGKSCKIVWRASPLCIFWKIWKTRNKITFEDEVLSIQRLKTSFICQRTTCYPHFFFPYFSPHFFPYFSPQLFPYFFVYYSVQLAYII